MIQLLALGLFLFCSMISFKPAQAGILIEPYVGFAAGTLSDTLKASPFTTFDAKSTANLYGGRLGLSLLGAWVAADYESLNPTFNYSKPIDTSKGTGLMRLTFIDAGFDLPFLFRFWGGYGLVNYQKINYQSAANTSVEENFRGGSAVKAGIGFKLIHFFSVNIEYIKPTFKKYEKVTDGVSAGEKDADTEFSDLSQSYTTFTVSFPLNLP